MSGAPAPRDPVAHAILYESRRKNSALRVTLSEFAGGRACVSVGFIGFNVPEGVEPRWRFVNIQPEEVRPVAEALLFALADSETKDESGDAAEKEA